MELRSSVKALTFLKNMLLGETTQILPYAPILTKPLPTEYSGIRLPRAIPEETGMSSLIIEKMIRELTMQKNNSLHSILVLHCGKIVAEGNYAPYSTKFWHVTHSLCKSFTGTAIGMLIDDGKLNLEDKLCDLLPEKCNFLTSKRTKAITIRHLLTMQSGVNFKEMGAFLEKDWARAFMEAEVSFEPGSKMEYNSMNSYMLSAIVSKLTGKTMCEFLHERLFAPLGFGAVSWDTCPMGISKGGWGMYIFAEDAVKLGLLYLQKGKWNVDDNFKQIISESWVAQATQSYATRETGEEYGFHIWPQSKNNCYLFNGMFGQYVMVFPFTQTVVYMSAGNEYLFTQCNACDTVNKYISSAEITCDALSQSQTDYDSLGFVLSNLNFNNNTIPTRRVSIVPWYKKLFLKKAVTNTKLKAFPEKASVIINKKFAFPKNISGLLPLIMQFTSDSISTGVNDIAFTLEGDRLCLLWNEGKVINKLPLGFGEFVYSAVAINGEPWLTACRAEFTADEDGEDVLKIRVCFPEASSARILKLWFTQSGCILKLDETPAVALAMERVKEEQVALSSIDPTFFKDFGYIEYKVNSVCAPVLRGSLIP